MNATAKDSTPTRNPGSARFFKKISNIIDPTEIYLVNIHIG